MTSFPAALRALRENRGHTQCGLATLAGLPPSVISLYESGSRSPSFESFVALAGALDVSLDDLAGRPIFPDSPRLDALERSILDHLTAAWNDFVELPDHHPDDIDEFRRRIHGLRDQLMARPIRRSLAPADDGVFEGLSL